MHVHAYIHTVAHTLTHVRMHALIFDTFASLAVPVSSPSLLLASQIEKRKMKHLCIFLLQVIHLWFEEFALEDTQLCTGDFITLQDSLGTIGINLELIPTYR